MQIEKAAVIGAGVMGAGIAAHVANAGVPVVLLDIVPEGASDRSQLARGAVERLLATEPAAFMHRRNAKLVTPGNLEDDLGLVHIVTLHVADAELEQHGHRARLVDALGDGLYVSSARSVDEPLDSVQIGRAHV